MIFRRDHFACLLAAALGLSSCGDQEPELTPLDRARAALAAGDAMDAQIQLEKLLSQGGDRTELAAYLGEAALAQGNLDQARDWLSAGAFSTGTMALGYRMLGRLALAEGDLAEAGRAFDRAYTIDPDDPELWVDIGRLRYRGGEQFQAIEAAERAVALDPKNAAALQFRGQLARDAQGMAAGVAWFSRALAQQPNNVELRVEYAATLGDAGRAKDALAVLRGSGGAALGNSRGLFVHAVIAARGDDILLARQLLERSGLERTGVPAALMLSAIIDIQAKNYATAAQTLERLYQLQPDNGRVVDLLAYALSSGGRERELIHRFARRAASDMGTPYLRTLVGRSFEALDDRVSATLYLDMAALEKGGLVVLPSFTPSEAPTAGGAGAGLEARATVRHALATGQVDVALDRARGYVQRNSGSGDAYGILGDAEFAVGDKEAAREAYLHSAAVRHPWPLTLRLVRSQPNQMAARELLERFVRDHPTNGEAAAMLADAYASEARWREAALLLDHAMRLGQARVPGVVAARSVAAAKLEDHEAALGYALDAHALQPLNPFAIAALVAALPESDAATRRELEIKLRSLSKR